MISCFIKSKYTSGGASLSSSVSEWAKKNLNASLAVLIAISFLISALPIAHSAMVGDEPATVIAAKTLTRSEPVVMLGSQFATFVAAQYNVNNLFLWAYRDGAWKQMGFQIDEANGTFLTRSGGSAGPHKQFYIPGNGWIDNDDELCFMSHETGDQINRPIGAPGANTTIQRYEITVTDPLDTSKKGWAYLFYHNTPPTWTSADYVSWTESTRLVNAYGYSLDYFDGQTRQLAFNDMRVKPSIGGTNTDIVDREKKFGHLNVGIDPQRCEYGSSTRGLETYYPGVLDDDPNYLNEYGVKDGPVRVIKHIRWGFGSANAIDTSDKMGWRGQVEYKYYSNMFTEDEIINDYSNSVLTYAYYRSIDHTASATPMSYYNSQGATATINGNTGDDSVPSDVMTWDQVSSARGSYVTRYKIGAFSGVTGLEITNKWIDNSAATDTDGTRTGAEAGRYGEHGISWYCPIDDYNWYYSRSYYFTYFLPANSPNVGATYASYADSQLVTNNPSPALQAWHADSYPPVTVIGTVLVGGSSNLVVPVSTAGNAVIAATVRDVETGNSNIASAVWTDGFANFPGTAMTATDGSFNSANEAVRYTANLATWPVGVHEIHVYGTDALLNKNETSTEHATVTILDDLPPLTKAGTVRVNGATTHTVLFSETVPVQLTATVDDTNRGFSDIISTVWTPQFAAFPGTAMGAADGDYDNYLENVETTLDLPSWNAGVYNVHVYGTDAVPLQNQVSTEKAVVTIIDDVAPLTTGVLLNGQPLLSMGITDDPILELTALVDDAGRGGTTIAGANYTIGAQMWGSSVVMDPVNVLDSATEAFSNVIDVTGWFPGTYLFYVYGRDAVPNCDNANAPFATLIITNEFAPEVRDVLIDGVPEISIPFSNRGLHTLTATLDDTDRGDNIIAGANHTVGMVNWPTSMPMTPVGDLDSPIEDFTATVDTAGWTVGSHDLYVYGWDEANDCNATSQAFARIVIYDDVKPNADTVRINGQEFYETNNMFAGTVAVTAWVDDRTTGNTVIGGANFTVGPAKWPGAAMLPVNALDSAREQFTATQDITGWTAGIYYFYAYGWDSVPNRNPVPGAFATLIIHDVMAPTINNIRINGTPIFTIDYANATTVELTALLDDTGRGNSEIAGANYTMGFRDWPSALPMATRDDEAYADVPVAGTVSGTYQRIRENPDDGVYQDITEATTTGQTLYNYASGTGTNKWAYVVDSDSAPMEDAPNSQTVLTSTQYTQISASDNSRYTSIDPGYDDYVSIRCNLYLATPPTLSSQGITLSWEGYVSRAGNVNIYARNQVAGTWTQVVSSAAATSAAGESTISGTLTGVTWANYIAGASNEFIFLVQFMTRDPLIGTTTMTTDYISANVQHNVIGLEHRWRFDMGSNPTFYVDAKNPATSDSIFKFQYSTNGGTAWSDFPANIQYAPGEVDVLKSSTIPLATYYDTFLVRVVTLNPGPNADTFSVDRMWATGQFNNNPEAVYKVIDISNWQPGEYQLYVYGWDKTPQYNATSRAYATLIISDHQAPEVLNFLVEGAKQADVWLSQGTITLTGTVDDSRTGNANIAWGGYAHEDANMTIGEYMTNDTALDSPVETFNHVANISGWHAGFNRFFMYGGDASGMNNETKLENVTVEVKDDVAPATKDWSTRLDGVTERWIDPLLTTTVTVTAIINDTMRGWSNITRAQYTVGAGNFTGNWMTPAVGGWDNCTKQVTAVIDVTDWLPDTYYIYVYGTDSWNNSQTTVLTYAILYLDNNGPAIEGPWAGPTLTLATQSPYVFVTGTSFVIKAYGDERQRGRSVVVGAEYFVDTIGANGTGTAMANVGFRFDSAYEGARATIDCSAWVPGEFHIYYIHFKDAMGAWGDMGSVLVMKKGPEYNIPIQIGWNLISLPLITPSGDLATILSGISWDRAYIYDPLNPYPWLSNRKTGLPEFNDFTNVDITMGIWVHATAAGTLAISGGIPASPQIMLHAGWNLVGYPTMTSRNAALALTGTNADMMAVYDSSSPSLMRDIIGDFSTEILQAGNGYWIHVPADVVWVINW